MTSSCNRISGLLSATIVLAGALLARPVEAEARAQAQGTLNLSHDLVRLGIAAQNLRPNDPAFDARPLFEAAVAYVGTHDIERLTVDRGRYYFLTPQDTQSYLRFPNLSDLTVDLSGSTILFAGAFLQGFALANCGNVTLTNFAVDFLTPPFTEVELVSVDPAARTLSYRPVAGWRDPVTFNEPSVPGEDPASLVLWAVDFRGGQILPGTSRMQVTQPVTAGRLSLVQDNTPWTQAPTLETFEPGDRIVVTERGGSPAVMAFGGSGITISHARVHGSGAIAVLLNGVSHSLVDDVSVIPREGALISSNADGIHFVDVRGGDHIRHSFVTRTLDDALAVDSLDPAAVVAKTGPRQLVVTRRAFERFPDGSNVDFVDPITAREIPGATIVSQVPPDSGHPAFNGTVTINFDRDLPAIGAGFGMARADDDERGAGSSIEDNVVAEVPFGRGIWVGGAAGVEIKRNRIGHSSNGGIAVAQDVTNYPLPPARNIVIEENRLDGSLGPMASGSGTEIAVGSILVESSSAAGGFSTVPANSAITIRRNRVVNSGRTGIWVGQLNGGTIEDNRIEGWDRHPELPLFGVNAPLRVQLLQDFTKPLVVRDSANVAVDRNRTEPEQDDEAAAQAGAGTTE